MENKRNRFRESVGQVHRLLIVLWCFVGVIVIAGIYLMADPTLSAFKSSPTETETVSVPVTEDDFDKVENGVHVRTGFVDAPGMVETIQNCTNCHSSKLVIQNRMNKERWIATIRWMQESQNLWDLGKNEEIIVDYLVTNYPTELVGRRKNLSDIDWYELKE